MSKTDAAWSRACRDYARAYPGATQTARAIERLKDQILAGEIADGA